VRNDAYQHFEDASASVSETVSEQHNENGKFLSVVATVASSDKMKLISPARRFLTNLTGAASWGRQSPPR